MNTNGHQLQPVGTTSTSSLINPVPAVEGGNISDAVKRVPTKVARCCRNAGSAGGRTDASVKLHRLDHSIAHKSPRPSLNPNGIPSTSPALRRGSYAGNPVRSVINPERVASVPAGHTAHGDDLMQPFQGWAGFGCVTQGSSSLATRGLVDTIPLGLRNRRGHAEQAGHPWSSVAAPSPLSCCSCLSWLTRSCVL